MSKVQSEPTPADRFMALAKTVFSVSKKQLNDYLKDNPLPRQKPGPKPKSQ